jgi:hypothetical protein
MGATGGATAAAATATGPGGMRWTAAGMIGSAGAATGAMAVLMSATATAMTGACRRPSRASLLAHA